MTAAGATFLTQLWWTLALAYALRVLTLPLSRIVIEWIRGFAHVKFPRDGGKDVVRRSNTVIMSTYSKLNDCVFSPCRQYRYSLDHETTDMFSASREYVAWIGLNPSIADEHQFDRTLNKILGFTKRLGLQRFVMLNLFALVSTDPKVMLKHPDPVGSMNNDHILKVCEAAAAVVCCWGDHGNHLRRADSILELLAPFELKCLGITKRGQPRHPLYQPANAELRRYL